MAGPRLGSWSPRQMVWARRRRLAPQRVADPTPDPMVAPPIRVRLLLALLQVLSDWRKMLLLPHLLSALGPVGQYKMRPRGQRHPNRSPGPVRRRAQVTEVKDRPRHRPAGHQAHRRATGPRTWALFKCRPSRAALRHCSRQPHGILGSAVQRRHRRLVWAVR